MPSGFVDLDRKIMGLQPGDLIIVAGRRRWARPRFALNIAEHVALHPSVSLPVAIFSMEMSASQLAMRMLSSMAKWSTRRGCAPEGSTTRSGAG